MKFLAGLMTITIALLLVAAPLASAQQLTAFGSHGFELEQNSCLFNNFRHGRWYGASEIWAVAKPDIYFPYCGKTIRICSADPSDSPNHCQATTMDVLIIDQVPGRIPVHMAYAVPEVLDPSFPGDIWLSKAAWDFIVGGGDVNTPHQVSVFLP